MRIESHNIAHKRLITSPDSDKMKKDTLSLIVEVLCPSKGNLIAKSCFSCIKREIKRRQRKSHSKSHDSSMNSTLLDVHSEQERIVLFNNDQILPLNCGPIPLSMRMTCYSRHHAESMGFKVVLCLYDYNASLVASCTLPSILVTDDRKPLILADGSLASSKREDSFLTSIDAPYPVMESVIPSQASVDARNQAMIVGRNFTAETKALFGDNMATTVRFISSEAFIVEIPMQSHPTTVQVTFFDLPLAGSIPFTYILTNRKQDLYEKALRRIGNIGDESCPTEIAKRIIEKMKSNQ